MLPRAAATFGSTHNRTAAIFKLFRIVRLRRRWRGKGEKTSERATGQAMQWSSPGIRWLTRRPSARLESRCHQSVTTFLLCCPRPYACSGVTTYGALRKLSEVYPAEPIVVRVKLVHLAVLLESRTRPRSHPKLGHQDAADSLFPDRDPGTMSTCPARTKPGIRGRACRTR